MHLNSHIYTQIVSLKLRNRDNKLYRILKASFRKVKIEDFFKRRGDYKKKDLFRGVRNKNGGGENKNPFFLMSSPPGWWFNVKKDTLSDLVFKFFPDINDESSSSLLSSYPSKAGIHRDPGASGRDRDNDITKYVLKFIKHIKLRGIRVEAKGRLTRPRTAARSVFKMRYLGGLKNFESSFLGLSTIMLRGDKKSNVSYSIINSKGRNGSFGVKG